MFSGAGMPAQNATPAPPSTQPASSNAPPVQTTPSTQIPTTQTPDDDDELPGLEPIDLPMASEPPASDQPPLPQPHGHPNPHIESDGDNTFVTLGFDMFIGTGPPPTFGPDMEVDVFDFFQGGVAPDAPNGAAGQPGPGAGANIFGAGGAPFATGRTMEELLSNLTNRLGTQFPPGQAPQPQPQPQHFQPQPAPPPRPRSAPHHNRNNKLSQILTSITLMRLDSDTLHIFKFPRFT
ncbi:hypothetical protein CPB85DRAFT_366692 [Mucidula mucida]|nr:hypothetical protein CPB85DRAFT_366692 [Mucidula mucida]